MARTKKGSSANDFILSGLPKRSLIVGLPKLLETEKKKDVRRAFTLTQKKEILFQQDFKCAECHKKLDPRATQYDHKKPWASRGRTISQNG